MQGVVIHLTLGQLVEAVGATTADLAEQVEVLHHVLRTCDAKALELLCGPDPTSRRPTMK